MNSIYNGYADPLWYPEKAPDPAAANALIPHGSAAQASYLAAIDYWQTAVMFGGQPCIPVVAHQECIGTTATTFRVIVPHYCTVLQVYYSASGRGTVYVQEASATYAAAFPVDGKATPSFADRVRYKGSTLYSTPSSEVNRALRPSAGTDPPYALDIDVWIDPTGGPTTLELYSLSLRPFRAQSDL